MHIEQFNFLMVIQLVLMKHIEYKYVKLEKVHRCYSGMKYYRFFVLVLN